MKLRASSICCSLNETNSLLQITTSSASLFMSVLKKWFLKCKRKQCPVRNIWQACLVRKTLKKFIEIQRSLQVVSQSYFVKTLSK